MNPSQLWKTGAWAVTAALSFSASGVLAAPVVGPEGMSFYDPAPLSVGMPGELIRYRATSVDLGADAVPHRAWNVMYNSTDALGTRNAVTGTVLVPEAEWQGRGERPLVSYAVGTHGLDQRCAPSLQLAAGTDYETANIAAALAAGYGVLVSDNPGYTNGDIPTYLAGASQGNAVLDLIRAAAQIPDAGISANARAAIWGYSQGGQTAAWAGELHQSYAPEINLVGIASGGTPADFPDVAHNLNANAGASFLMGAIIGLGTQYPDDLPVDELANAQGQAMMETAKDQCVFESLFHVMNADIASYTVNNMSLTELLAIPSVGETVEAQNLGGERIAVPLYQYHGQADEFIPIDQHIDLKRQYCRRFGRVAFDVYPSEHIVTQFQAAPRVLDWLGDRFAGKPAPSSCLTFKPEPESTANPGGGNFVVTLDEWLLDAAIDLERLGQTVELPEESRFTADADMTAQTLDGSMVVPSFRQKLKILLPLDVDIAVEGTEPVTGSIRLDDQGQLSVDGTAYSTIEVQSAGLGFLQIPFGCRTADSVEFPIQFQGPVSALGTGDLTFSGTTSFPEMTGCGLFTGLFTTLMSGPGQVYGFNVRPPAPERY